jgi:hypothetical protein
MMKPILGLVMSVAFLGACPESPKARILFSWTGTGPGRSDPECFLVGEEERWTEVWKEHCPESAPPEVDFGAAAVVALLSDFGVPGSGFDAEVVEDDEAVRLRCRHRISQVKGSPPRLTVYGFFVLPRSAKPIVVELGVSADKARETIWEERGRFE